MTASTLRRLGGSLLVLVWLALVVAFYYGFHSPLLLDRLVAIPETFTHLFGATLSLSFAALANVLGDAATILVLILLSAVLGHLLCKPWNFDTPLESITLWTGIGLGALGFIVLAFAALGILYRWLYWALILISFVLLRRDALAVWQTWRAISLPRPTRIERALALFCALALVLTFLFALTPPWGWDGIQYHLVIPKLILAQGHLAPPPR